MISFVFAVEFIFSVLVCFLTIQVARKFSIYDIHDDRRMHKDDIPRLGGLSIFAGVCAALVFIVLSDAFPFLIQRRANYTVLFLSGSVMFLMGFVDDLHPLKARVKLMIQLVVAVAVCAAGFRFHNISFSPIGLDLALGGFSWVITVLWIVGIINVVNMFDGLDGLAGTTALLVIGSYAVFFLNQKLHQDLLVCLVFIPAILAFLVFNLPFPRAKIFMGDGGSQFLGFVLAVLPLLPNEGGRPTVPVWYAATLMVFPFCDAVAAVWRRIREHRPIMSPDFSHLHHKLVAIGFSQRQTLCLLIALQFAVALLVCTAVFSGGMSSLLILISVWILAILFFTIIHINKDKRIFD